MEFRKNLEHGYPPEINFQISSYFENAVYICTYYEQGTSLHRNK